MLQGKYRAYWTRSNEVKVGRVSKYAIDVKRMNVKVECGFAGRRERERRMHTGCTEQGNTCRTTVLGFCGLWGTQK